jgi:hypothetical protein
VASVMWPVWDYSPFVSVSGVMRAKYYLVPYLLEHFVCPCPKCSAYPVASLLLKVKKKVKLSPLQAVEACRVVRW